MKITKIYCKTAIKYILLLSLIFISLMQFKNFVVDVPLGVKAQSSFVPINQTTDKKKLPLALNGEKSNSKNMITGEFMVQIPSLEDKLSLYIPYYRGNLRIWVEEKLIYKSEISPHHFNSHNEYEINYLDQNFASNKSKNHSQIHIKHMVFDRIKYDQDIYKNNNTLTSHEHSSLNIKSAIIMLENIPDNKDKVVIRFSLENHKNKNYSLLSKFYFGEFEKFVVSEDRKAVYYHIFQPIIASVMVMLLILVCLLTPVFKLYEILPVFCMLFFRVGISLQEFSFLVPTFDLLSFYSICLVPIALVGFHEFLFNMIQIKRNYVRWRIYIFGLVLSFLYFILFLYFDTNNDTNRLLIFPVLLSGLSFIIIKSIKLLFNQKISQIKNINDMVFFSVALTTWLMVLIYDIFGRFGFLDITIPLTSSANLIPALILGCILFRQIIISKNSLEVFNDLLSNELKAQSKELSEEYERREEIQKKHTIKEDYARINEDLHDGILTYLHAIKTLSDKPINIDKEKVHTLSQFALNELRVILKSNINRKSSLILILSNFREHVIDALEALNIKVIWDSKSLIDLNNMDLKTNLEILRVIQEAVHNAINRGKCKKLHFIATFYKSNNSGHISFQLLNSGGETFFEKNKTGNGIKNMEARIKRLKGEFSITSQPGGAIVKFNIPI